MAFFAKRYTRRTLGSQTIVNGFATNTYHDDTVDIDLQVDPDQMESLPDGQRIAKVLKGWGDVEFKTSDAVAGRTADRVLYNGHWYECTSCVFLDHTILNHYRMEFTRIPEGRDAS